MTDRAKKQELLDRAVTPGAELTPELVRGMAELLISGHLNRGERALLRARFPRPYRFARRWANGTYGVGAAIVVGIGAIAAHAEGALYAAGAVAIGVAYYHGQRAALERLVRRR